MAEPRPDQQEKTEPATPKRLEDARRRGQVARSRELSTTALVLAVGASFLVLGPRMVSDIGDTMRASFTTLPVESGEDVVLWEALADALAAGLLAIAPILLITLLVAALAPMALGGWSMSAEAVTFKWEKLDPVRGLQRVFSWRGLIELLKALAKFVLITGATGVLLWLAKDHIVALGRGAEESALRDAALVIVSAFLLLGATTVLIAAVDVPFQIWSHARQLRMSRQEVKDELKETDGKPEVKSRVRALQREVASRRMMQAVPEADVVVTNPEHYACALRYDPDRMGAPRLVAKGAGYVALRIRGLALAHEVPIVSAPPLARSLFRHTQLDREIPLGLYVAVAEVLAHVHSLRRRRGDAARLRDELPIPDELRFDPD